MRRLPAPAGRAVYKGRSLGSLVPKVTRTVFQKFGFATATLLTDWSTIVGPELAEYTAPERLKWPRAVGTTGKGDDGDQDRLAATLVLRVEPARALDVSYRSRQLIDRINAYFGYRAVEGLRFVQAPVARLSSPMTAAAPTPAAPLPAGPLSAMADDPLRAALATLGASIAAERQRRAATQSAG